MTIAHCILNHLDEKLENEVIRVGVGPPTNETIYEVRLFLLDFMFLQFYVHGWIDLSLFCIRLGNERLFFK